MVWCSPRPTIGRGAMAHRGEPWLSDLAEAAARADTADIQAELAGEVSARQRWLPRGAWLIVGPLAILGAALIVNTWVIWLLSLVGVLPRLPF